MIHLYKTETGSIYEADDEKKRIRRLSGINEPTPRQGLDGEWKEYTDLLTDYDHLVIVWGMIDGSFKTTITSKIVDYDEIEITSEVKQNECKH